MLAIIDWLYKKRRAREISRTSSPEDEQNVPVDHAEAHAKKHSSILAQLFFQHRGRSSQKWTHYLDVYDSYFSNYRARPIKLLEIGINQGGSLQVWREYFGPEAVIFGIDLNPECAPYFDPPTQVRIGSQADPVFLRAVIAEMGAPDIIIDDGSHVALHQEASFRTLFPLLREGGLYVIEDLHTSYWRGEFAGGYNRRGTAIELVKQLIDDMNGWWHKRPQKFARADEILGIHVHDSIVFIAKGRREQPYQIRVGQ